MKVEKIKATLIKPYWNNPRIHTESLAEIIKSIRDFGFNQPIIVDKKNVIVAGHGRYEASKMIGMETIPVIFIDLPEKKAREYRIADNKTAEESTWNYDKLLAEISLIGDKEFQEDYFPEIKDEGSVEYEEIDISVMDQEEEDENAIMCPFCDHIFNYETESKDESTDN